MSSRHGEDDSVATVLPAIRPSRAANPESLPAGEWVRRADRRAWEEIIEEL